MSEFRYYLGVDLGREKDPTAVVLLEKEVPVRQVERRVRTSGGWIVPRIDTERLPPLYRVRYIERLPLRTSYPEVVERIRTLLETPQLRGQTTLVVDRTGVGVAVTDLLRREGLKPRPITITGGDLISYDDGIRCPKRELVSTVAIALEGGSLTIDNKLSDAAVLREELLNFRVRVDPVSAHDSYGEWRVGKHDDMVLALAIALFVAVREPKPQRRATTSGYYSWPL